MFEIVKTIFHDGENRSRVIETADTFDTAKDVVRRMGAAFMEDDADYPGCADAFMNDGSLIVIQPVGFTLKAQGEWQKGKAHAKTMNDAADAFDAEFGITR